jgi:hypothetical protein
MSFAGTATQENSKATLGIQECPKKGAPAGVKGSFGSVDPNLDPRIGSAEGQRKVGVPGVQPKELPKL